MPTSAMILPGFALASPWLAAAGVLLAGIPILIHLLRRQRCQTRDWGAMQFVLRAARRRSRRTRLEALLLLTVRTLIILFVAFALARPYVEATGVGRGDDAAVQHVLIVDTSASMAYSTRDGSCFERAIAEVGRIVESAQVGDAFNLLRIGGTGPFAVIRRPAYDVADVRREISRLELTDERGRLVDALAAVPGMLADDADIVRREVYLLTDLQATNWSLESPADAQRLQQVLEEICRRAGVSIIDVGETNAENAAVIDVEGTVRLTTSRMSAVVTATLRNFSQFPRPGQRVALSVNDQVYETRSVDLPTSSEQTISFDVPISPETDSIVEVRLIPDELASDDSRWLVLPPARDYRVLLVDGAMTAGASLPDASGFLRLALQPDAAIDSTSDYRVRPVMLPSVISDGMLADVRLSEFDCIYLCNVPLLTEREVNLLEQFVVQGGGLVVVLGDAVRPGNYNDLLHREARRLLPGRLLGFTGELETADGGMAFEIDDYSHPILAPFEGNETAGLLTTRIDRYMRTEPDPDPAIRTVLRYSSGDAAILERSYGDGRVMLVTTPLNDHWGNWALWPSFVPMVHELTRYASAGDFGRRERLVGEQIVRRIPESYRDQGNVWLEFADERPRSLRVTMTESGAEVVSPPLQARGRYELRLGGDDDLTEMYVVNVDPMESDLAKLDSETLEDLFPPQSELRYLRNWQPRSADDTTAEIMRNSLATWFLVAACCLLLVEQLMAWQFPLGVTALGLVVVAALVGQLTNSLSLGGMMAGAALAGAVLWWGLSARRIGATRRNGRGRPV